MTNSILHINSQKGNTTIAPVQCEKSQGLDRLIRLFAVHLIGSIDYLNVLLCNSKFRMFKTRGLVPFNFSDIAGIFSSLGVLNPIYING